MVRATKASGRQSNSQQVREFPIDVIDWKTAQTRSVDDSVVEEYAKLLEDNVDLSNPDVFDDGESVVGADGAHRAAAHKRCGRESILCNVHSGGPRDAMKFALSANARHGLRRSNADKRRAVEIALADQEWREWSDHAIGELCGVSNTLVGTIRKAVEASVVSTKDTSSVANTRLGRDGRRQPATKRPSRSSVENPIFSESKIFQPDVSAASAGQHQEILTPPVSTVPLETHCINRYVRLESFPPPDERQGQIAANSRLAQSSQ